MEARKALSDAAHDSGTDYSSIEARARFAENFKLVDDPYLVRMPRPNVASVPPASNMPANAVTYTGETVRGTQAAQVGNMSKGTNSLRARVCRKEKACHPSEKVPMLLTQTATATDDDDDDDDISWLEPRTMLTDKTAHMVRNSTD